MEAILKTFASLYVMARYDEELNYYCEVKCTLVMRGLQIGLGSVLNNATFEDSNIGNG